ncbi:MAG TPA: hypothetical protein VKC56_07840 [Gallionellaceae bacterium]|nr:hypothetical protein [Gallionellaceae bacterium]
MVTEENKVNEENAVNTGVAGDAGKTMDDYLSMHKERWQKRVQIIVALVAVFILYMIYFMMHE